MLHHAPAVGRHGVGQERVVHALQPVGALLAEARPHGGAPRQIGEHHRDGAYLACCAVAVHPPIMAGVLGATRCWHLGPPGSDSATSQTLITLRPRTSAHEAEVSLTVRK